MFNLHVYFYISTESILNVNPAVTHCLGDRLDFSRGYRFPISPGSCADSHLALLCAVEPLICNMYAHCIVYHVHLCIYIYIIDT